MVVTSAIVGEQLSHLSHRARRSSEVKDIRRARIDAVGLVVISANHCRRPTYRHGSAEQISRIAIAGQELGHLSHRARRSGEVKDIRRTRIDAIGFIKIRADHCCRPTHRHGLAEQIFWIAIAGQELGLL